MHWFIGQVLAGELGDLAFCIHGTERAAAKLIFFTEKQVSILEYRHFRSVDLCLGVIRYIPEQALPDRDFRPAGGAVRYAVFPGAYPVFLLFGKHGNTGRSKKNTFAQVHIARDVPQSLAAAFGTKTDFVYKRAGVGQFLYPRAIVVYNAEHKFVSIEGVDFLFHQVITITRTEDLVPLPVVGNGCFLAAGIVLGCFAAARCSAIGTT